MPSLLSDRTRRSSLLLFAALSGLAAIAYACGDSGGAGETVVPPGGDGGDNEASITAEGGPSSDGGKPPPPLFASKLGAGTTHACAARSDGSIACWGDNTSYKLGVLDAGAAFSAAAVRATTLTGSVALTGTFGTSCALLDTAELGCWGSNAGGLLGELSAPSSSATPVQVGGLSDVVAVTGGEKHACLLRDQGVAFCWGNNDDEQLGSGVPGAGNSAAPAVVLDAPKGLKAIGSGSASSHTCAIRPDDQIICWGLNSGTGQLGAPAYNGVRSPNALLVDNVPDAVRVATGRDHTCAIRKGGAMRCWGANQDGQLGFGVPDAGASVTIAQDVPGVTDAVALSLGAQRTCVVRATGKVLCWGRNSNGGLGAGNLDAGAISVAHVEVVGIDDAEDVALGADFRALRKSGKVSCWGDNALGQLGGAVSDGGTFSATPIDVTGL